MCKNFVIAYKSLAGKKNCKRLYENHPSPSLWFCEAKYDNIHWESAETLSKLNFKFAKSFYSSEEFREDLDGAIAKEHLEKSLKLKKN